MKLRHYTSSGLSAIDPKALGIEFPETGLAGAPMQFTREGRTAVVHVCGPLTHSGMFFQSYGDVRACVRAALAAPDVDAVVMRLDTPGGDVYGVFDAARGLRADARAAGKPLIAFTESQACSSGYCLASAADAVVVADSAHVGSIGVIACNAEVSRAENAAGVTFTLATSGARKADGNPHVVMTDDAFTALQASVDVTAELFFAIVREHRGIDAQPLQAGVLMGGAAVAAGLADRVLPWEACLAAVAAGEFTSGATLSTHEATGLPKENSDMPFPADDKDKPAAADDKPGESAADDKPDEGDTTEDKMRAALVVAAGSDDPEKAARAKKALAAYDSGEDEKASAAAASSAVARAVAPVAAQLAKVTARLDAQDRAAIFKAHAVPAELQSALSATPTAALAAVCAALPKAGPAAGNAAPLARAATGGAAVGSAGFPAPTAIPQLSELDRRMGAVSYSRGITETPTTLSLGVLIPKVGN